MNKVFNTSIIWLRFESQGFQPEPKTAKAINEQILAEIQFWNAEKVCWQIVSVEDQ